MQRAFTGEVSWESLREFAVGFLTTRFTVSGVVVKHPHVEYDDIDMHILLAKMTTFKMNYERKTSMNILDKIN